MQVSASDGNNGEEVATAQVLPTPAIHYTFDTDLNDTYSNSTLTAAAACPADPCNSASSFGSDSDGNVDWQTTLTVAEGAVSATSFAADDVASTSTNPLPTTGAQDMLLLTALGVLLILGGVFTRRRVA